MNQYLKSVKKQFDLYRSLGEKAIAKVMMTNYSGNEPRK